jgi:hypothetical protein
MAVEDTYAALTRIRSAIARTAVDHLTGAPTIEFDED